jgi:predicted nucleotidyltransferase
MTYGLSESDFQIFRQVVIDPLHRAGARIWIFGSRARGDQRPFSDIDLLYSFPVDRPPSPGFITSIAEAAENSRLSVKVDLVAENALAPSYRDGVIRDRKEVT